MADTMIGRESERQVLERCLDGALAGNGSVLLITGDAGIGKSALVASLSSAAAERGMPTCVGECAVEGAGIPYMGLRKALTAMTGNALFDLEEFSHLDEVFLISNVGLLISHVSGSKEGGIDEDILGSMLTAVQDFVKDSFGGGEDSDHGGLGKLEYKDTKIFIEHGETAFLAAVSSGLEHPDMKGDIRRCLADIESRYFDLLADWDGDVDALSGAAEMLEALVARDFRVRATLENVNIDAERLKVQNRVYDAMRTGAAERGLLVVLEDVHWADESTALAIPFLARNIPQDRILLCLTCRPDELSGKGEFADVLDHAASGPGSARIDLAPLDTGTLHRLVSGMLQGGEPPEDLMGELASETRGNPFYAIEAVRALLAEGALSREGEVWVFRRGTRSAIPHTVVELVSRRLEALDLDCLRLVEYGAILGRRFPLRMLSSGFRMGEGHVRELSGRLVSIGLFSISGEDVMFQHSKVQEVVYAGMSDRWRLAAHRNAGLAYESLHANRDEVLFELAYHFSRTLDHDRGIEYCISAGHKARNNFAPREAAIFFERAISILDSIGRADERCLDLSLLLGELYELDGNYAAALDIFDRVIAATADGAIGSKALMEKGRTMQAQGRYDDAISAYGEGASLAERAGARLMRAKINGQLGKIYLRKGEYDRSLELQRAYLAESQSAGEARDVGQAHMNMGGVFWHMGNQQTAISHWEKSLAIFEGIRFIQGIANIHDNLGVGYSTIGEFDRSLEHYTESEKIMARIGDVRGMSMVLLNIGVLYTRTGDNSMALDYLHRSLQMKLRIGDSVGAANIYNNLGYAYYNMERFSDSKGNFQKNLEIMERSGDTWGVSQALRNLAEAEIELSEWTSAEEHCTMSMETAEKHGFTDIMASDLRLMGIINSHKGEFSAADEFFARGLEMAKATADPQRIGMAHFSQARSYAARGEAEKAVDSYAGALEVFDRTKLDTFSRRTRLEMEALINCKKSGL